MRTERYHSRDLAYSAWHRQDSIGRFIGPIEADLLKMIDIDAVLWCEYHGSTRTPLALIETARDVGQIYKPATVTAELARMCNLPGFCLLVQPAQTPNPASTEWCDIRAFRVQRLWPRPEDCWRVLTPDEWAQSLLRVREWSLRRLQAREAANDAAF